MLSLFKILSLPSYFHYTQLIFIQTYPSQLVPPHSNTLLSPTRVPPHPTTPHALALPCLTLGILTVMDACVWNFSRTIRLALETASAFPVTRKVRLWSLADEISMWAPVREVISAQMRDEALSPNWLPSILARSSCGTRNTYIYTIYLHFRK